VQVVRVLNHAFAYSLMQWVLAGLAILCTTPADETRRSSVFIYPPIRRRNQALVGVLFTADLVAYAVV